MRLQDKGSSREAVGFVPMVLPERSDGKGHRRGEAVSELMPWLSADAGKSKRMVTVPIVLRRRVP
jgi:hypothetical protein